jgi:hypothetical protein
MTATRITQGLQSEPILLPKFQSIITSLVFSAHAGHLPQIGGRDCVLV